MKTLRDWIREIREMGLEVASNRFYSMYAGVVKKEDDPQQQSRVKVEVPNTGHTEALPQFAYPSSPYAGPNYGFYFPPHLGDTVHVWFDHGDPTQPMFCGGYWRNPDNAKKPATSEIPAEFRKDTAGEATTARGVKSKGGSGLIFEDDEAKFHVEVWTGENQAVGQPATRHHRFRMDDAEEQIFISTFGGHSTTWQDKAGEVFVETKTTGGHRILMDDTGQRILIQSSAGAFIVVDDMGSRIEAQTIEGHKLLMSDTEKRILLQTLAGQKVELNDILKKVTAQTATGNMMVLDGTLLSNQMLTPSGALIQQGPVGTQVTDPGPITVVALGGPLLLTGQGMVATSAGGAPALMTATGISTGAFTGLKTDTYLGGWASTVIGLLSMTATIFDVVSSQVGLGSGARYRLVDERFFASFLAHVHTTTIPGAPTGPPFWFPASPQLGTPTVGIHTTVATKAS